MVYAVVQAHHNFESAKKYGEIKIVYENNVSPFNLDLLNAIALKVIEQATKEDYILFSGGLIINAIFFSLWMGKFGCAKLLIYHSIQKTYELRDYKFPEFDINAL